ncbi:hypothetical protein V6N13_054990 [Hibiscus sabdariffa]|uniref:Uncharacterized protein n=1 Tax=Hibiscus sabdariffa TaxID=183260 RepID=A0ABR2DW53_9ROSI
MAYRRRHGITRSATFKEEIHHSPVAADKALTSSLSFSAASKGFNAFEDNESKGFWGTLARKAKAILEEDDNLSQAHETQTIGDVGSSPMLDAQPTGGLTRIDSPRTQRGLDKLNTSLNHIGDTFEKATEEGGSGTIVGSKAHEIIQETRNLKIRRKGSSPRAENQVAGPDSPLQHPSPTQLQNQNQIRASRDVAMATASKAKLLLRELKSVKADYEFAKERCAQLEEENKFLRECREKGDNPADDDLIRVQLESLLAEKARLAHENTIYARENRFLRDVVEYHQLSMRDVVYLDEGAEEDTEVESPVNLDYSKLLCESPTEVGELSPHSLASTSAKEEMMHISSPPQDADNSAPNHGRETPPSVSSDV